MRSICWLALATLFFVLPGCSFSSTSSWLKGDWIFDLDASKKALGEPAHPPGGGDPLADGIGRQQNLAALAAVSDLKISITDKETAFTVKGKRTVVSYEVVSSVPDQKCVLKVSNGIAVTYYKAGDDIYLYPDKGSPQIKLYFKRKP